MITRIVKMTFRAEYLTEFIEIFNESATLIASFEGCCSVRLMQDANNENVYFTLSNWQSEDQLNAYRSSLLFKTTWGKIKPMFSDKAQAWSLVEPSAE